MLQASWIGRRVVVRRVVGRGSDGGLIFGDVVGDLVALGPDEATIDTSRASEIALEKVALPHIAMAKIVEASAADVLALQRITAQGIRSSETAEVGGWLLRADPDSSWRANSVRPLGQPGLAMDEALAAVQRWYGERGKLAKFLNPTEARRLLDAELGERRWDHPLEASVLVARIDTLSVVPPQQDRLLADRGIGISLSPAASSSWLARYRTGAPTPATVELLGRHDCVQFAQLDRDGQAVAIARGVVDEGWLGLSAIWVHPDHRRQGLGKAIISALLHWGQSAGATRSYLEVSSDNEAAIALYEALGFWNHHDYRYRVEPTAEQLAGHPAWPAY